MSANSQQLCGLIFSASAKTASTMLLLSLMIIMRISSSLTYDIDYSKSRSDRCTTGLSPSDVRKVVVDMADQSNIFEHILPNILKERISGTVGNLEVREFIKDEMSNLGWYVEEDSFVSPTPAGEISFSNVIATLNPSVARRIVMACHYDSKLIPGAEFVGATDSAVPCAILMDTARKLGHLMATSYSRGLDDFTFQFIFFDGEEALLRWSSTDSLYGARHLADLWQNTPDRNDPTAVDNLQNIDFFALLDLIGTSETRFVNFYRNTSELFLKFVQLESCLDEFDLRAPSGLQQPIFDPLGRDVPTEDDHKPFIQKGVPVLHLISVPFPSVWHTPDDNLQSLDRGVIADFSALLRLFIVSLLLGV